MQPICNYRSTLVSVALRPKSHAEGFTYAILRNSRIRKTANPSILLQVWPLLGHRLFGNAMSYSRSRPWFGLVSISLYLHRIPSRLLSSRCTCVSKRRRIGCLGHVYLAKLERKALWVVLSKQPSEDLTRTNREKPGHVERRYSRDLQGNAFLRLWNTMRWIVEYQQIDINLDDMPATYSSRCGQAGFYAVSLQACCQLLWNMVNTPASRMRERERTRFLRK